VRSADVKVEVTWRVDGLPSSISIIDPDPNGFLAEFSTEPLNEPLLPGTYSVTTSDGDGAGATMTVGAQGIGGPATGVFEVIEMQAEAVTGDQSDSPAGLTSFTAAFDMPYESLGGCVSVVLGR
jgi:hypothetical protein